MCKQARVCVCVCVCECVCGKRYMCVYNYKPIIFANKVAKLREGSVEITWVTRQKPNMQVLLDVGRKLTPSILLSMVNILSSNPIPIRTERNLVQFCFNNSNIKGSSYCKQSLKSKIKLSSQRVQAKHGEICLYFTSNQHSLCGVVWLDKHMNSWKDIFINKDAAINNTVSMLFSPSEHAYMSCDRSNTRCYTTRSTSW